MKPHKNSLGYEVINHRPQCDCGQPGTLVMLIDTYACATCDKWLEKRCECTDSDKECCYHHIPHYNKPSELLAQHPNALTTPGVEMHRRL